MDSKRAKSSKILKDRFSELPDDVLSFTLSFLPIREASRTSILSCRWRSLWKDSLKFYSSLTLDVIGMRDSDYTREFLLYKKLMLSERFKFVKWVDKVLQLDYGPLLDTFRLRFEMNKEFSHHIDRWISVAIDKKVQTFDIDLSEFRPWGNRRPNNNFYTFPDRLFTQEAGVFMKCLYLKSCILGPLDFKFFSSLVDLKLDNVLVDQDNLAKFLTDCPNLEKLWLVDCYKRRILTISGSYLKLKELTIVSYECLRDVKINARNLKKLEYCGAPVKFSFANVPELSNLAMVCSSKNSTSVLSYALGKLSSDLPRLETLFLAVNPLEKKRFPSRLPSYNNLKKLVVKVVMPNQSLWGFVPLFCASPCLHWLELHLFPSDQNSDSEFIGGRRPCDSPHLHLKQILVTGFDGSSHEMEFMRYLFENCEALQIITLDSVCKVYDPDRGFYDVNLEIEKAAEKKKIMQGRAQEQLMPAVPPGVQLFFV